MVGLLSALFGDNGPTSGSGLGINSSPGFSYERDFAPTLGAIGMSLLSSPRGNPLQNLPTFMQQANAERDKQDQRNALVLALKQLGLSDDQAKALAINPEAAKIAATAQGTLKSEAADRRARDLLGGGSSTSSLTSGASPSAPAGPASGASMTGGSGGQISGSLTLDDNNIDVAVRTALAEAGNQGPEGLKAVAGTLRNRALLSGKSVAAEALKPNQFEPWNPDSGNDPRRFKVDSPEYQAARAAILPVLTGEAPDPTGGATHFYAPKAQARLGRKAPSWDDGSGADIGDHRFFRLPYAGRNPADLYQAGKPATQVAGITPPTLNDGTAIQTELGPVPFTPSATPGPAGAPPSRPVQVAENEADVRRLEQGMASDAAPAAGVRLPTSAEPRSIYNDPEVARRRLDELNKALFIPNLSAGTRKAIEEQRQEVLGILKPTETSRRLIDAGLRPGTPEFQDASRRIALGDKDKDPTETVAGRQALAEQYGFRKGTPEYVNWVLGKKLPKDEETKTLSVADRNAILKADEAVESARGVVGNLQSALDLSKRAYDGPTAPYRGQLMSTFGNEGGNATVQLDNLITTNTLGQLKSIFGGNPTEGERKILLDIQGSSSMTQANRDEVYRRALAAAQRRIQVMQERADEMRGGTYYQPGGGRVGNGARGQASTPAFSQEELLAEARRRGIMQ